MSNEDALRARIAKLERINGALMAHVERATDQHGNAYSLFQTAILLEGRVRGRTQELTTLMHRLERSNEALKAAKEEAERANRSKTRFLAAASHDLLQPLSAARLSTAALAGLPIGKDAGALASQIERGLQTIEDLIKTLLDISKLDAGVVLPVRKPLRLRAMMAGIEESFRPVAEQRHLRFVIRCPDLTIESDATLLQRVVQNLVSNALRYTIHGGVIVAARRRGNACLIEVIDTGPGIPEGERDLVFEEFYRGKSSAGPKVGLGLGLSIVRRLALALDHPLSLRSRVGHGTIFRIETPLTAAAADMTPDRGVTDIPFAEARVLVIENDPASRVAMQRLLESWHLKVGAFADIGAWEVERSLEQRRLLPTCSASKNIARTDAYVSRSDSGSASETVAPSPDLVIADYHLDDGALGLDAVARVRAAIHDGLPAIVATADHSAEVEAAVLAAGCALVHKPIRPAQLRSLLTYLLQAADRR